MSEDGRKLDFVLASNERLMTAEMNGEYIVVEQRIQDVVNPKVLTMAVATIFWCYGM